MGRGEAQGTKGLLESVEWRDSSGQLLDCEDKIALLNERLQEIESLAQDTFADGLLMGVDESQLRSVFARLVGHLRDPWRKRRGA